MRQTTIRLVTAGALGAMVLGSGAPPAQAGTTSCRVRNVTQETRFWSPWDPEQPEGGLSSVTLTRSVVRGNTANSGGGIWVDDAPGGGDVSLALDAASTVTRNTPDDCSGTTAC